MKKSLFILGVLTAGFSFPLHAAEAGAVKRPLPDKVIGHRVHSDIVADPSLPYCAHMVNVHAKDGKVTLKGRVHTPEQREIVGDKAAELVGNTNVINNVTIKAP